MTEFPANALPAREGPFSSPPTTDASWRARRAGLAEPTIEDHAMSTSDLKIMKEQEASFLTAIDTHEGIIHKICYAWSRNRADEEDLYQEIVYQLWKAYPSFKGDSSLSTWIYSVALKSAMLPFRRNKIRIELPGVLPDRPSDERVNDGIDDQLFKVFQRLEDIDRAVLVLVMQGFAAKEIGAVLDLSHKAVTMRMSRIRGIVEWTK